MDLEKLSKIFFPKGNYTWYAVFTLFLIAAMIEVYGVAMLAGTTTMIYENGMVVQGTNFIAQSPYEYHLSYWCIPIVLGLFDLANDIIVLFCGFIVLSAITDIQFLRSDN